MCEFKEKIGKLFTSKFVGTGPLSYKKRIYRAAVSQRLRNTVVEGIVIQPCFALRRVYGLRNASLGDFVVVRTPYNVLNTNLDSIAYYTPSLYGIA